uniref:Bile salt-activated lipase n=1 Tax=Amphiprion percula TaxID=161767 RepID=A0A3P8S580_AMPPE
ISELGVVHTEAGMVEGENIQTGSGRYMDVFKGVPFADVPGRFEKPKRHPGWDGVFNATENVKECLQMQLFMNGTTGSEDCLYLNICVPHGSSVSKDLAVMVWIYGEGFTYGNSIGHFSDANLYNGQQITERGNVIVVSVGYRVGTLGFLSTGDSSLPGNYGLWDQQAAIAWVHRNRKHVQASISVCPQTLTPHNRGLIRRAISHSGVALCSWAVHRNPRSVAEVNCLTDHNMAACLKTTGPEKLTMAGVFDQTNPVILKMYLLPVIDGDFLPDEPSHLFHNAADINYMAGVNNMDGFSFTTADIPSIKLSVKLSLVEYREDTKRLLAAYTKDKGSAGAENAFSTYTSTWETNPSQETIKKTVADIGTDYMFLAPTQAALYLHAAKATTKRTYSYQFSEPNLYASWMYPSWMGADHFDEVQYMFGRPFTKSDKYWPYNQDLSGYMITYWTNFAKTGDPNQGCVEVPVSWPTFTSTGQQYLEIHHDMDQSCVKQNMRQRYVYLAHCGGWGPWVYCAHLGPGAGGMRGASLSASPGPPHYPFLPSGLASGPGSDFLWPAPGGGLPCDGLVAAPSVGRLAPVSGFLAVWGRWPPRGRERGWGWAGRVVGWGVRWGLGWAGLGFGWRVGPRAPGHLGRSGRAGGVGSCSLLFSVFASFTVAPVALWGRHPVAPTAWGEGCPVGLALPCRDCCSGLRGSSHLHV